MVDHLGLLIAGIVTVANCGDREGLELLLYFHQQRTFFPKKLFADQGYTGEGPKENAAKYGIDLEPVKRRESKGFIVEARRWIVERTFAWLGKARRLSKDYELTLTSSNSMMYLCMIRLMLRRIACLS